MNSEDAKEMAAMTGMMYLNGVLNADSKAFHVVASGSPLSDAPFWNEHVSHGLCGVGAWQLLLGGYICQDL